MGTEKDDSRNYTGGHKDMLDGRQGAVAKYKSLVLGENTGLLKLIKYELITSVLGPMPGALGYLLRKIFFPKLMKKTGRGVVFGRNMTIRHPEKIVIGDNTIFDDNSVLDAKGESNEGIEIGSNVLIGRGTILSCKNGNIRIGDYSNLGPGNTILSETELSIGKYVYTAGHLYMIAGGNHSFDRRDIPMFHQPSYSRGGISLGDDVWIGANATILDGVRIGEGSVIGAAAMVNKEIPSYSIAVGAPAKVIKER